MALIDNEPRSASAVAVGEVELIPIDRAMFQVLMRNDPDSRSPLSTSLHDGCARL